MATELERAAVVPAPLWQDIQDELDEEQRKRSRRSALSELRHAPERVLHRWRRRNALAALAKRTGTRSVLFVCIGNLYRSPFAAALLPVVLPAPRRAHLRCSSAGCVGPDREAPPDAVAAAERRGLNLESHRSRPLIPVEVAAADLIVVMDAEQKREICARYGRSAQDVLVLGDLDPEPIVTRAVADPCDQPAEVLEESYDRLIRCVRELGMALIGLGGVTPIPRRRQE